MTPTLLSLAGRVEQLTGPCRETDALIGAACRLLPDFDPTIYISRPILVGNEDGTIKAYVGKISDSPADYKASRKAAPFTASLDAIRSLGGMVVFASDIGADGLAMVKIVVDTSTSPIVEYTGIASQLEHAWLAAALRALSASESSHD